MGAFMRQLAVLAVLWAACELLLPDGRQQQLVRMTVSVLVMTALLSTAGDLLAIRPQGRPALAQQALGASEGQYHQTVIRAAANQTAAYCRRFFARAGYETEAGAFFHPDGSLERIEITVWQTNALISPEETARLLAGQLGMETERIQLSITGAEME